MKVIGVVGGMGAGKTTVVSLIQEIKKVYVIACDQIGHELLLKGHDGYDQVIAAFGSSILSPAGEIVRNRLGQLVFHDPKKLEQLNHIIHPLIYKEVQKQISKYKEQKQYELIIIDAALLIEMGLVPLTNKIVAVYAEQELRIDRIVKRQGLSKEQVLERFSTQKNWEEFKNIADAVIDTSFGIASTKEQVKFLLDRL